MTKHTNCCDDEDLTALAALLRNRYFYGKQMGVEQFRRDQTYHRHQAWLLNRLVLGSGVLCGLQVEVVDGALVVSPGVALDGWGRVVIVPERQTVKIERTCDRYVATLRLCHCERCVLPAPSGGDPCHPNARVEHDAIEESFRLELRREQRIIRDPWIVEDEPKKGEDEQPKRPTAYEEDELGFVAAGGNRPEAPGAAAPDPARPCDPGEPQAPSPDVAPAEHRACGAPVDPCLELAWVKVHEDGIAVKKRATALHGPYLELAETIRTLETKIQELQAQLEEAR